MESRTGAEKEPSLLPVLGVVLALAAVLARCLPLLDGPETYILCDDLGELSERLDREASVNPWLLLAAALVLSAAAPVISRVGRGRRARLLPALMPSTVLILVVLADGYAARADAVALQISTSRTCDEPTSVYNTSRGWFDWSPLGHVR
ncbi:hypothetical protein ACWCPM_07420 [Streptomyces sp. NPDC002309]